MKADVQGAALAVIREYAKRGPAIVQHDPYEGPSLTDAPESGVGHESDGRESDAGVNESRAILRASGRIW